ncbi:MAG: methyltransferase domain-containing protein [Chloroflexi bacterium]|nr:methyltransferase domain-containing protein [Chloroflexota bacterium]MBI5713099.1 methyltransferase domain-containing protein [Chloroflexota bacterium]
MKLINLGCGTRYHRDWVNVDFVSLTPDVIAHDLSLGVPFQDNEIDAVYHSHVLEHFSKSGAVTFLQECRRVLKPKGVLRVVVPDLETIVKQYIKWRDLALTGDKEAQLNYGWIMLEMYDQVARNFSGGYMAQYLSQDEILNTAFVRERMGTAFEIYRRNVENAKSNVVVKQSQSSSKHFERRFMSSSLGRVLNQGKQKLLNPLINQYWRERRYRKVGKFRLSGEIHQWMYDRYSLTQLLTQCGFRNPKVCGATESLIPNWLEFNLDTEPDGSVYKADSLFMEAIK